MASIETYEYEFNDEIFSIEADTHRRAFAKLARRLRVTGPRAIVAYGPRGSEIHVSLAEDQRDMIIDSAGRNILT